MKAFVIERYGKQEPLQLAEVPEPKLGEQDVLVQIHAASINPLDLKIRSGALKRILPLRLPLVLGNDLAGSSRGSVPRFSASNRAMRSMRAQIPVASAPSPSASLSPNPTSP